MRAIARARSAAASLAIRASPAWPARGARRSRAPAGVGDWPAPDRRERRCLPSSSGRRALVPCGSWLLVVGQGLHFAGLVLEPRGHHRAVSGRHSCAASLHELGGAERHHAHRFEQARGRIRHVHDMTPSTRGEVARRAGCLTGMARPAAGSAVACASDRRRAGTVISGERIDHVPSEWWQRNGSGGRVGRSARSVLRQPDHWRTAELNRPLQYT